MPSSNTALVFPLMYDNGRSRVATYIVYEYRRKKSYDSMALSGQAIEAEGTSVCGRGRRRDSKSMIMQERERGKQGTCSMCFGWACHISSAASAGAGAAWHGQTPRIIPPAAGAAALPRPSCVNVSPAYGRTTPSRPRTLELDSRANGKCQAEAKKRVLRHVHTQ